MTAPIITVCARHGLSGSTARSHFRWGRASCLKCRETARKAAYKARRRDPNGVALVRALYREFDGRRFTIELAEPIAVGFGVDARRLEGLLTELGPGDFDPESGTGAPGDGVVDVVEVGSTRTFRFDESWVGSRARKSVAGGRFWGLRATLSTSATPSSSLGNEAENGSNTTENASNTANPLILDRPTKGGKNQAPVLGHVDVAQLIDTIAPELAAAAARGEMLLRVSLTLPPWSRSDATAAAEAFGHDMVKMGASAVLMARDYSKTGAAHWHGVVTVPPHPTEKATRALVGRAWVAASGSTSAGYLVDTVTAWCAFAASGGDLDATVGSQCFRTNLTRTLRYTFKSWPCGYGQRRLSDVLEAGFITGATLPCATPTAAPPC
jgi:hypothetical protein